MIILGQACIVFGFLWYLFFFIVLSNTGESLTSISEITTLLLAVNGSILFVGGSIMTQLGLNNPTSKLDIFFQKLFKKNLLESENIKINNENNTSPKSQSLSNQGEQKKCKKCNLTVSLDNHKCPRCGCEEFF